MQPVRLLLLLALLALLGASMAAGAADAPPDDALRLSGTYGCMSCHGMVKKQVGPGFAQISARYRGDAAAPARLAEKIRGGSVGAWGRVIMPRQPKMTVAESETLARWVLAQPPHD
jgi:cytochrome c